MQLGRIGKGRVRECRGTVNVPVVVITSHMADLLASSWSQFAQNALTFFTSLATAPPLLQTSVQEEAVTDKTVEDIQQRILRGPAPARYEGPGDKLSAREALRRLRLADRRRRVRMRMSGSSSGHSDKPDVVFFPTDGSEGDGGGCQDATAGGGGFNTFSFLAFLLAGFNAISVVSNNNNNRENSRKSSHKSF